MPSLSLSYDFDDYNNSYGLLTAEVHSGAFRGAGSAYFNVKELTETFVPRLMEYPLSKDLPPKIEGGVWSRGENSVLESCNFRVLVEPFDARGSLIIHTFLASKTLESEYLECAVHTQFLVEYSAVLEFAKDLQAVLSGTLDSASISSK